MYWGSRRYYFARNLPLNSNSGMDKRQDASEVGKGVGESLPLVSSKKAGQCASAPCPGQI